ncbi:MAG: hypothetical protein R2867_39120 [Caldilineaceae bacterium]
MATVAPHHLADDEPDLFVLITNIILSFQIFTNVYVMTSGAGPANSTMMYVLHLYLVAFRQYRWAMLSALAWVIFVILLLLRCWSSNHRVCGSTMRPKWEERSCSSTTASMHKLSTSQNQVRRRQHLATHVVLLLGAAVISFPSRG